MLSITTYSIVTLLFVCNYTCFYYLGDALLQRSRIRSRLIYQSKQGTLMMWAKGLLQQSALYRNTAIMLESIEAKIKVKGFIQTTMLTLVLGLLLGSLVFTSVKGVFTFGFIFGTTPYIVLRMLLMSKQMKTRSDFLPAVEVFYQNYVLSSQKNIRIVIGTILQEQRMMYPIKPLFTQLERNLSTHRNIDDCLRIFALSLGHTWADYFINMLRVGLIEGVDISNNLKELIGDMRKAQRADQVERNRLLEIRIANFTPLLFLGIFLFINFKINYSNAYYYYLVDAAGRNMLLDALLLIFASFIMGLYLSIKRM